MECVGVFEGDSKRIRNTEPERLYGMRAAHVAGEVVRIIFDDTVESTHERAFKLFHVYRDQYANLKGWDKEAAKAWLKYKYGSGTIPWKEGFRPPVGERGSFLEVEGRIYWMRSTTVYSTEELSILIEGTIGEING